MPPLPSGDAALEARGALAVPTDAGTTGTASLTRALAAYVRLARPADSTFAFVGTILGAGLAGLDRSFLPSILLIAGSNALLSAASMAFNDWHDVEEDRINRPSRPIPSGAVSAPRALVAAIVLFLAGIAVTVPAGRWFGLGAVLVVAASVAYTCRLKTVPFLGNIVTASLSAYPLWCWAAMGGQMSVPLFGAAAAFFLGGAGREIIRTSGDYAGDLACGIRTVATAYGGAIANRAGLVLILIGLATAQYSVWNTTAFGYRTVLAGATLAFLAMDYRLRALPPGAASHQLTRLARTVTALLALAVAGDLLAGWPLR
jgi:geranylgeranylglycerol-phosphate geranylgeranyltransferase